MQVDQGRVARGLRIAVRHAHHTGFLQAQHVAEVVGKATEHGQFGGSGVGEHRRHANAAHQVVDGVSDSQRGRGQRRGGEAVGRIKRVQ
ncbi:hypothetical protein D3C72_1836270 [compost metagenome]